MSWFKQSNTTNAICSFCLKSYKEVGPLVEGPNRVFICGACIRLCDAIVQQEYDRRNGTFKPFLLVGRTYRFTICGGTATAAASDKTARLGVLRKRLPHPDEHWIQIEPTQADSGTSEAMWMNLHHVHTISEIGQETDSPPPTPPKETSFRVIK